MQDKQSLNISAAAVIRQTPNTSATLSRFGFPNRLDVNDSLYRYYVALDYVGFTPSFDNITENLNWELSTDGGTSFQPRLVPSGMYYTNTLSNYFTALGGAIFSMNFNVATQRFSLTLQPTTVDDQNQIKISDPTLLKILGLYDDVNVLNEQIFKSKTTTQIYQADSKAEISNIIGYQVHLPGMVRSLINDNASDVIYTRNLDVLSGQPYSVGNIANLTWIPMPGAANTTVQVLLTDNLGRELPIADDLTMRLKIKREIIEG